MTCSPVPRHGWHLGPTSSWPSCAPWPGRPSPCLAAGAGWRLQGQAIQEWQVAEAAARSGVAPDERQPKLHGDELEVQALNYAVWQRLAAHLTAAGLDPDAIDIGMGSRCD